MTTPCVSLSPLVDGIEEHVPCRWSAGHHGLHSAQSEPSELPRWSLVWDHDDE